MRRRRGSCCLKNEGDLLPLAATAKRIAVIGGRADRGVLSGGGSSQVRSVGGAPVEIPLAYGAPSSFSRITYHASSPLAALRKAMPDAEIVFARQDDLTGALEAARGADIAIVFATQWTSEAQDVPDLRLPDQQDALVAAVAAVQPRTVAVHRDGRPRADAMARESPRRRAGVVSRPAWRRGNRQYPDGNGSIPRADCRSPSPVPPRSRRDPRRSD